MLFGGLGVPSHTIRYYFASRLCASLYVFSPTFYLARGWGMSSSALSSAADLIVPKVTYTPKGAPLGVHPLLEVLWAITSTIHCVWVDAYMEVRSDFRIKMSHCPRRLA